MKKRIGIDLHVVDGKFQGSRTHVLELFSRVILLCPDVEFFLFSGSYERLISSNSAFASKNVSWVELPASKSVARVMWELPKLQREHKLDLLHTQYIIPMPSACPCLVTIHDLLFESYPQYFTRVFRARSKWLIRRAARRSLKIITDSQYSRASIEVNKASPVEWQHSIFFNSFKVLFCAVAFMALKTVFWVLFP